MYSRIGSRVVPFPPLAITYHHVLLALWFAIVVTGDPHSHLAGCVCPGSDPGGVQHCPTTVAEEAPLADTRGTDQQIKVSLVCCHINCRTLSLHTLPGETLWECYVCTYLHMCTRMCDT